MAGKNRMCASSEFSRKLMGTRKNSVYVCSIVTSIQAILSDDMYLREVYILICHPPC